MQAQNDLTTAYNNTAATPCTVDLTGKDLGGLTLTPGIYCFSASAQLTGALTLDALGNSNARFVFKIGSTLTTASSSSVTVINGGSNCDRVIWQVGSSAMLGAGSSFVGDILALTSISLGTGTNTTGKVLARNGAVTLDTNNVNSCGTTVCPIITVNPASLPNGSVGTPYNQTVSASGGTSPNTFAISIGSLPSNLLLNSSTGAITGTPTTAGTFSFTVTATDASGCSGNRSYSISIASPGCPAIALSPSTVPPGTAGTPYNQTVSGSGGTAPYTFAIWSGSLPGGLTLNPATGAISGTPTQVGLFNFQVRATDAVGCQGARQYSLIILCSSNPIVTTNADSGVGSLRQAIADACDGSTVTFDMSQVTSPITLTSAELLINKNLTITGPGANLLTVQRSTAGGTPNFRVFNIQGGNTVSITDLTIANGKVTGVNSGGGLLNDGTLTMTNCNVYGNSAPNNGGGIFNNGSLTLNNCNIGGTLAGQPNTASVDSIFNNSGTLLMTGGSVVGNSGRGMSTAGGLVTLNSVAISNNSTDSAGGGIFIGNGTASITNCLFANNTALNVGGAILISASATPVTVVNSTFSGNSGSLGGGINAQGGTITLTNVTLTNNRATNAGGGINRSGGTVILRNTIVAGNFQGASPSTTADNINGAVDAASSFNLIGSVAFSGGLTNGVNNNQVGIANPGLAPLASNGGSTQTHALLPGSPAINTGSNAFITNPPFSGPPFTDQRGTGFARITNTTVDIGAFESRGFTIALTSGSGQSTPILSAFGSPLVATVSSGFSEPVAGGVVTFTAPSSGAGGTFAGNVNTATINAGGVATSATFTANGTAGGPYNVVASIGTSLPTVNFALTNSKGNQTITFGGLATKTFGNADFAVSATATSGLAVSFAASGQCTVAGATVHLTGAGSCTITASQGGDANFNAAADVPQSFTIAKSNQTITFGALANKTFGDADFAVSATASSSLAVSFAASGQCTVVGTTVHLTGPGSCTITAKQAGDTNYNAAADVPQSFTINGALIALSQSNYNVDESANSLQVAITRTGSSVGAVSVSYSTSDASGLTPCNVATGMASQRCDYTTTSGTVTFADGETSKVVTLLINEDAYVEGSEVFTVTLSNLVGTGTTLGAQSTATVTILDNDLVQGPNPLDSNDFFIRQLYHDLLNREPDSIGFANWLGTLNGCPNGGFGENAHPECDRVHVATGFFLSEEFRDRGDWVYRFYEVGFARPSTYAEFMPDLAQIGGAQSPASEALSKAAYIDAFVQRTEFKNHYDGLSNFDYVNALEQNAGVTLSNMSALIAALDGNQKSRAQVLREIVEAQVVVDQFFIRSFVRTQYFGFLRRDPDTIGFNNWVTTLTSDPANSRHMIFGFIYSDEYRHRFGP
jgi:hypothetical protein